MVLIKNQQKMKWKRSQETRSKIKKRRRRIPVPKKKESKKKEEKSLVDMLNLMYEGGASLLDSDVVQLPPEEFVSTGISSIDKLLGGGFKRGVISEVYGAEGGGKTTLCLQAAARTTALGEQVVFLDCEHALNTSYVPALGIDTSKFIVKAPDSGEQTFAILETLLKTAKDFNTGLIVVDSVAAMAPEADDQTNQMASHARMMSKGLRSLVRFLGGNVAIVMINQIRAKVGVTFGSKTTTTGGNGLRFFSSVRLDVTRVGQVKNGDNIIGQRVKLHCKKNKYAAPYQSKEVDLVYGEGFDFISDVIDTAIASGIIAKAGGWFSIPGFDKSIQGRGNLKSHYKENEKAFSELTSLVL